MQDSIACCLGPLFYLYSVVLLSYTILPFLLCFYLDVVKIDEDKVHITEL